MFAWVPVAYTANGLNYRFKTKCDDVITRSHSDYSKCTGINTPLGVDPADANISDTGIRRHGKH